MTNRLITPRLGPGICSRCCNFTLEPAGQDCRACRHSPSEIDVLAPISYALAGGQLHRDLADYKRTAEPAVPDLADDIARTLAEFLARHERCVARRVGAASFDTVVVVPSGDAHRDELHPLRRLVRDLVPDARSRFRDALRASGEPSIPHTFDPRRFRVTADVRGARVLLIDDMWTTGASAQSAAWQLRHAGATSVSAIVVGRYVNGSWGGIAERVAALAEETEPGRCVFCAQTEETDLAVRPTSPLDAWAVSS